MAVVLGRGAELGMQGHWTGHRLVSPRPQSYLDTVGEFVFRASSCGSH